MDYEKKYRDLVEAVKELQEANPSDEGIQNWVNDNVPELKESEGERYKSAIRKMYSFLPNKPKYIGDVPVKDIFAWLEKQDEQKPIESKFKVGDVLKKKGKDYTFTVDRIHAGYYFCESAFFPIEEQDKWELVEQKPVEWGEEDENIKESFVSRILENYNGCSYLKKGISEDRAIDWLKSLKDRCITTKPHWKPSETEISILEGIFSGKIDPCNYQATLLNILEQLKAL